MGNYEDGYDAIIDAERFEHYIHETDYYKAICVFFRGELEEAERLVMHSLERKPQNIHYNFFAAFVYAAQGKVESALHFLETCRSIKPESEFIAQLIADYAASHGFYDKAIKMLDVKDLVSNEDNILAMSEAMYLSGDLEESLFYIKRYFSTKTSIHGRVQDASLKAYFLRGRTNYLYCKNNPGHCIPDLLKACMIPDCPNVFYYLSSAYFDINDFQNALRYASEAISADPDNTDFQNLFAGIKYFTDHGLPISQKTRKAVDCWQLSQPETLVIFKGLPPFREISHRKIEEE
jgi:tetratricopeptide (TPR) repeat protein